MIYFCIWSNEMNRILFDRLGYWFSICKALSVIWSVSLLFGSWR